MPAPDQIQVLTLAEGPELAIVEGPGRAHAVVWPGMGAQLRSMHRIELSAGARTIELRHPGEAVYYVISGGGNAIDVDSDQRHSLRPGAMAHIDGDTGYVLSAGEEGLLLVGGPAPPDPRLYEGVA